MKQYCQSDIRTQDFITSMANSDATELDRSVENSIDLENKDTQSKEHLILKPVSLEVLYFSQNESRRSLETVEFIDTNQTSITLVTNHPGHTEDGIIPIEYEFGWLVG